MRLPTLKDEPGRWLAAGVGVLVVYGVVGYLALGYDLAEAVHNTLLVLTTVGFTPNDVASRAEKLFTASIAGIGVAMFLTGLAMFTTALAEGRLGIATRRRRMDRRIASLSDHYIICAYGRVGRAAAREFEALGIPFVVVDRLEDLRPVMSADGVVYHIGDPTSERVLRHVGIERARGLVSAVDSDADNVYIVLTARSLNPDVFIVARASEAAAADRLYRAGADRVVSPYVSSGRHMASLASRPGVVDYLDIAGQALRLEEMIVSKALGGKPLGEVCGGATPLVVRGANGEVRPNPEREEVVNEGDLVVLLGDPSALAKAERGGARTRPAARARAKRA